MLIQVLKSKIHRAVVTGANVDYVGSLTLDPDLSAKVGLTEHEKVLIASLETGRRVETYVINGKPGSRQVMINGAAARQIGKGERVIIMSFGTIPQKEAANWQPKVLIVDENNRPAD